MLETNLVHIESQRQYDDLIEENERVVVCCGRMGPMCIPVYGILEVLQDKHPNVQFRDIDFDDPVSDIVRKMPECNGFFGLPITVYLRNGQVVAATSSIQTAKEVKNVLKEVFS